ncbi:autotransporter domain-containing protein [Bosea caraganae]|uniref:autotransporter domain-containing protein n=1 Tax=Bosea caraganae TaxID=2763117 RepID=UPI0015F0D24E|nr:autotransporter domain-containing protein [Bosea caraganae]
MTASTLAMTIALAPSAQAQGTITYGSGESRNAPIAMTGNTTLEVPNGQQYISIQAGVISGAFGIVKTGGGALRLDGDNTYTGGTNHTAGLLLVGHQNALGTGALTMAHGTSLSIGAGITVNNATMITGSVSMISAGGTHGGVISGSGELNTSGFDRLILSGNNVYTGGTTVQRGILALGSANAAGTGSITLGTNADVGLALTGHTYANNVVLQGGVIIAESASELSGTISGTGPLRKRGTGALTLSGSNSHAYTDLNQGALRVANSGALGAGVLRMSGGTTLQLDDAITVANRIDLQGDAGFQVAAGAATISGAIGEAGRFMGITKTGAGELALTGVNTYTGNTRVQAGQLTFAELGALSQNSFLMIDAGATAQFRATQTIGDLSGAGRLDIGDSGAIVGYLGSSSHFSGIIEGDGHFHKIGSGELRLSGDGSRLTGDIQVMNGTLRVDGTLGDLNGVRNSINVAEGGTLTGNGHLGAVWVHDGGILRGIQGDSLRMHSLNLSAGSVIDVELTTPGATAGLFEVNNNLVLDGRVNVANYGTFGQGVYRLVNYGGTLTDNGLEIGTVPGGTDRSQLAVQTSVVGEVNIVNAALTERLFWDGSDISRWNNGRVDGGAGTWSGDIDSFTTVDGASNGRQAPTPGFVIFQNTGGMVIVDDGHSPIEVTGMQFAADGYGLMGGRIQINDPETIIRVGDGTEVGAGYTAIIGSVLTGSGRLVKTDYGTLVLTGANDYAGGTEVRHGTLVGNSTSLQGDIANNARLVFDQQGDGQYRGLISGSGTLVKTGAGLLDATARDHVVGSTVIEQGVLEVSGGSQLGAVRNDGALSVHAGADGSFASEMSGSGEFWKRGIGNLTLTGTNTYSGGTRISDGTLTGAASSFGTGAIVNDAALVIDQAVDGSFGGGIHGSGAFTKQGAGTLTLTGVNDLEGATTVAAGRLVLNGSLLNSAVTVQSGAVISGNGATADLTVLAGGTIAPGNSVGSFTVGGNLVLAPGSTYAAEIAGNGDADSIMVAGQATIGGSRLAVTALDPRVSYQNGQSYIVLMAAGGINGSFAEAVTQSAFIDVSIDQTTEAVAVSIKVKDGEPQPDPGTDPQPNPEPGTDPGSNPGSQPGPGANPTREPPTLFGRVAQTRNQLSTARALDTLPQVGGTLALYNSLLMQDAPGARAAFDQLSGEIHASAKTALVEESGAVRAGAIDRLRSAFGSVGAAPMATMSYGFSADKATAATGPMPKRPQAERFAVWGQGYGSFGHSDGNRNAARLSRSSGGLMVGADVAVFDNLRFGALAGYSRSEFDAKGRVDSGSSDNYHLGLYGGGQWGGIGLRAGASYTWHDVDTRRTVSFTGFGDSLKGGYNAGTAQVFGELGYRVDLGRVALEPFAGLAYVNLHSDGFTEQGGAAALAAHGSDTSVGFSTLGLRVSSSLQVQGMELTLRGTLGWRHAFGDTTPLATLAFAGSRAFSVAGVPVAKNAALVETGLDLAIGNSTTLGLSYTGQLAGDAQDHAFKGNLAVKF